MNEIAIQQQTDTNGNKPNEPNDCNDLDRTSTIGVEINEQNKCDDLEQLNTIGVKPNEQNDLTAKIEHASKANLGDDKKLSLFSPRDREICADSPLT